MGEEGKKTAPRTAAATFEVGECSNVVVNSLERIMREPSVVGMHCTETVLPLQSNGFLGEESSGSTQELSESEGGEVKGRRDVLSVDGNKEGGWNQGQYKMTTQIGVSPRATHDLCNSYAIFSKEGLKEILQRDHDVIAHNVRRIGFEGGEEDEVLPAKLNADEPISPIQIVPKKKGRQKQMGRRKSKGAQAVVNILSQ